MHQVARPVVQCTRFPNAGEATMKVTMTYQRDSKNQYVYNGPLGCVMYVPKIWVAGQPPQTMDVELPEVKGV